jgi:hypothetical protein
MRRSINREDISVKILTRGLWLQAGIATRLSAIKKKNFAIMINDERGDVPGWVLVVLMTTGLVTAIWTIAAPRLSAILKNSLDAMNGIR